MKARVLIVDDEEDMRQTVRTFVEKAGHEAITAGNISEALALIESEVFDVVVLDILLGDRSGLEVLREIKGRDMPSPIILITAMPGIDAVIEYLRLGAFDYIPKPIRQETLLRVVRMALKYKALLDDREKYRANIEAIFKGLGDALMIVDTEMRVTEANDAVRIVCGHPWNEVIIKSIDPSVSCCGSCASVVEEALKTGIALDEKRVECKRKGRLEQIVSVSTWPVRDTLGSILGAIVKIRDVTRLEILNRELAERSELYNIVGESIKMKEAYTLAKHLAAVESVVLITGEAGTGKKLMAEFIHYRSVRSGMALVKVSCSVFPDVLLESELFGHVRGAFVGAVSDRVGRFHMANGGTIFLDEIGDISPKLQLRLLKVLQNKEIERVGDSKPRKIDVRVIAATKRDLRILIREGKFREDLYDRIRVVEICVPSLRERRDDIPLLVKHLVDKLNKRLRRNIIDVSWEVLEKFMAHNWPGNIREMENALEHAFIVSKKDVITISDLPEDLLMGRRMIMRPRGDKI